MNIMFLLLIEKGGKMKIISWNVAHLVRKQQRQMDALLLREPDIIGLQEVTRKTISLWKEGFKREGYTHIISSFDLHGSNSELIGPRKYGILIASRWPMTPINQSSLKILWQERLVSLIDSLSKGEF